MPRYQTASQRASGESRVSPRPPSGWVSAGTSNLAALCAAMPPLVAGPADSAAKTATQSTATRVSSTGVAAGRRASGVHAAERTRRAVRCGGAVGVACCAMTGEQFTTSASFVAEHRNDLTALATVIVTVVLAQFVDRALVRRGERVGKVVAGGPLSPVASTRLRLVRRLIFAAILLLGLALALAQFPSVKRVAAGVLASSAVLGLVVGFAARQT